HLNSDFMPRTIGAQNKSMSHQLPAAASHIRRPSRPQLPPLVYCSISKTSDPVVRPSQNMKENNQDLRNRSHLLSPRVKANASTANTTPTTSARERMRSMIAGGANSCGVMRIAVWL